ncbi:replication factor A protein 2 [Steccherinum ochraceum]|uniref:Replication factor A protein 2 n=1 Tax=Steccherinum ochraceum TaxID=92696 RepID=A0A4R0R864_9APHY|nr:replication factor A protein 2 [Steccherinum ochraceum]
MADDSFYQDGAGTQHPDFGSQEDHKPLERDWQTALRPVTIRQIHDAELPYTKADFKMNGKEVKNLTIVAQIISEDVNSDGEIRRITYTLEDGTSKGRLRAFYNGSPGFPAPKFPLQYGRFSGTLFRKGATNFLKVNHLRPVKDVHEIYSHVLEVVAVTLLYERGPPVKGTQRPAPPEPSQSEAPPPTAKVAPTPANDAIGDDTADASSSAESFVLVASARQVDENVDAHEPDNAEVPAAAEEAEAEPAEEPPDSDTDNDSFKTAESDDEGEGSIAESLSPLNNLAGLPNERDPYSHLSTLQRDILLYLYNTENKEEWTNGTHVGIIFRDLQTKGGPINISTLSDALDKLVEEKHIDEPKANYFRLIGLPERASDIL